VTENRKIWPEAPKAVLPKETEPKLEAKELPKSASREESSEIQQLVITLS